jgi:hypothetical protein
MLKINESSIGAFLLTALSRIYLVITFTYYLFPALAEYQPYVYLTLLFSPATQTCCLDENEGLEFFDEEF